MSTVLSTTVHPTIEVHDVGPIRHLSIPIPKDGGLVCLKGTNDIGKSETLTAIESVITKRGKVEVRRGAVRGELDAFGVSIKIAGKTKRTGELEVESLEGRFSIEDLIDPKIKDPIAADAKRIKTLIQVTGSKPSPELFYGLLSSREEFDSVVSSAAVESDDIVVMADRIKRDIEAAARKEEDQGKHADGRARGARESAAGVDLSLQSDPVGLQKILETAIREESSLKANRDSVVRAEGAAAVAREELEQAQERYKGPTVSEAIASEQRTRAVVQEANDLVVDLEARLREAKQAAALAQKDHEAAKQARIEADRHAALIKQWQEQIAAAIPQGPSLEQVTSATEAVVKAREAVENGAIVRRAKEQIELADKLAGEAKEHTRKATRFRDAAKATDEILSSLVASSGTSLRVEAGRLMVDTSAGPKQYAELSHGTRSKMALDIAIEAVGEGGVIVLHQEYFEGIAPAKQRELAQHVKGRGVLVLTAKATDDTEIVPEVMGS